MKAQQAANQAVQSAPEAQGPAGQEQEAGYQFYLFIVQREYCIIEYVNNMGKGTAVLFDLARQLRS